MVVLEETEAEEEEAATMEVAAVMEEIVAGEAETDVTAEENGNISHFSSAQTASLINRLLFC